jgi:membrane-associated phospholipid phosphatase
LSADGWGRDVLRRLGTFWTAKTLGTPVAIGVFFVVYFAVLRHPAFPPAVMPMTAVDRAIGFQPAWFPLYMSLWFYVSFAPGLLDDARALRSYVVASVALASSGLVIFWFWPTMVPAMASENAVQSAVGWLKRADAAGNACPSLHVAFALFSGGWIDRVARELRVAWWLRAFNALWCAGIIYSTIALRQHVFLDVLAGALLGAIAMLAHFRWLDQAPPRERRIEL